MSSQLLKLAVLFFAVIPNLSAAGFCAVSVFVTDESGKPATALVQLLDGAGTVVQSGLSDKGHVDFCDFGFGDHSIHVGAGTCAHMIIPHVKLVYRHAQLYRVYRNPCSLGDVSLVGCPIYLRVLDEHGRPIFGGLIESDPAGVHSQTDEYGRAQISLEVGESRTFVISKRGFGPARIEYACACSGSA